MKVAYLCLRFGFWCQAAMACADMLSASCIALITSQELKSVAILLEWSCRRRSSFRVEEILCRHSVDRLRIDWLPYTTGNVSIHLTKVRYSIAHRRHSSNPVSLQLVLVFAPQGRLPVLNSNSFGFLMTDAGFVVRASHKARSIIGSNSALVISKVESVYDSR